MKSPTKSALFVLLSLALGCGSELPDAAPPPTPLPDPTSTLQQIAEALRDSSGAPGAVLGVAHGDRRFRLAAGHEDLLGLVPMAYDKIFRAGSILKLLTGTLILQASEQGRLSLDDKLSRFVPGFPGAASITIDMLLSHTAGVTTTWFDDPTLQAEIIQDLSRVFSPEEVIERLSSEPPAGAPGQSGMHYANLDFVLLGQILSQVYDQPFEAVLQRELLTPLSLRSTSYGHASPPALMSGYLELMGVPLDAASLPQTALLSYAGSAGALHSNLDDLLGFLQALFRDRRLLQTGSLAHLMLPAEPGSWYAHAAMRFCPCDDEGFSGIGHGGNLPGYWSVAVYYPALDLSVVAAINRDSVNGQALDRSVFDATLRAVVDTFEREGAPTPLVPAQVRSPG